MGITARNRLAWRKLLSFSCLLRLWCQSFQNLCFRCYFVLASLHNCTNILRLLLCCHLFGNSVRMGIVVGKNRRFAVVLGMMNTNLTLPWNIKFCQHFLKALKICDYCLTIMLQVLLTLIIVLFLNPKQIIRHAKIVNK